MAENNDKQNSEYDELICPITLELFHDPVKAKDGHVYEREAITRWILEHGTSPLTREPLQINDLQPDDRLRNLARQRRNSTVSYNSHNETITLPPLRRIPFNSHRVAPANIINPVGVNSPSNKYCCRTIACILLCFIIPFSIIISTIFAVGNVQGEITSVYSGDLTSNSSKFNRLYPSSLQQNYYYDAIKIDISQDGTYQFQSQSSLGTCGYFYENSFNSTNFNSNLVASNYGSGGNFQFYIEISLTSYNNYTLVVTTSSPLRTGSFLIYVTGPATVNFN